ncbi:hypothetical protein [Longispora urticae]
MSVQPDSPEYPSEVPRLFGLYREEDPSGVSGTGLVAWGVQFWDGMTVTRWRGNLTGVSQVSIWESLDQVLRIHGHDGRTRAVFCDDEQGSLMLGAILLVGGFHERFGTDV